MIFLAASIFMAETTRPKLLGFPLIQLCSSSKPSMLRLNDCNPAFIRLSSIFSVRSIPLLTMPQRKPRSLIALPMSRISLRISGSPPVVTTIMPEASVFSASSSSTGTKSSNGISFANDTVLQSLPQWRQLRLQRRVHSQNNCSSGCNRFAFSHWSSSVLICSS